MPIERVIAYIDGFNLYFGLKESNWRKYYWLNIKTLCEQLQKPNHRLLAVKYFTSRVNGDPSKSARQDVFWRALKTIPEVEIFKGQYGTRDYKCSSCNHKGNCPTEKMTDVYIASELVRDTHQNKYDTAFLISGDRDLVPAINIIRETFPSRHIKVIFPPNRYSPDLQAVAHSIKHINKTHLNNSVFPDTIPISGSTPIYRPASWA
jgi:uncharacterized LabA/DUF88 family protein